MDFREFNRYLVNGFLLGVAIIVLWPVFKFLFGVIIAIGVCLMIAFIVFGLIGLLMRE